MAEKRKDSKGRILKTGETERSDGRYQYRFTQNGRRYTLYASTLKELREKEDGVQKAKWNNIDYRQGQLTVSELCDILLEQKANLRPTTKERYQTSIKVIQSTDISCMKISEVTIRDVKRWCVEQCKRYKPGTVRTRFQLLKQVFSIAYNDRIIDRNPCHFEFHSVVSAMPTEKKSLTVRQSEQFIQALKDDKFASKFSRLAILLLHTGIRVGECLALTKDDINFEQRLLHINKQVVRYAGQLHIAQTKTNAGERYVPLDDEAINALAEELSIHPPTNDIYDGYNGVIFYAKKGLVHHSVIVHSFRAAIKKYNVKHSSENELLPDITPHMLRHTFCSVMAERGLPLKVLQYVMGHSDPRITLSVYTHISQQWVESAFHQVSTTNLTPFLTPIQPQLVERYGEIC